RQSPQPASIPVLELAQIWSALAEIKSAQAGLQAQQDALSSRLSSLASTVEALPKAQEQFVEVVNFHHLNSQLSHLLRRMDSRLKLRRGTPDKTAKAKTNAKNSGESSSKKMDSTKMASTHKAPAERKTK